MENENRQPLGTLLYSLTKVAYAALLVFANINCHSKPGNPYSLTGLERVCVCVGGGGGGDVCVCVCVCVCVRERERVASNRHASTK